MEKQICAILLVLVVCGCSVQAGRHSACSCGCSCGCNMCDIRPVHHNNPQYIDMGRSPSSYTRMGPKYGSYLPHVNKIKMREEETEEQKSLTAWVLSGNNILPTSRSFIQVDNELKYLVDGVAIHMNEGVVPLDILPGLADSCTEYLASLPKQEQLHRPPSCSDLTQPLDLRDCDPAQGGHIDPFVCAQILQAAESKRYDSNLLSCGLDICYGKSHVNKECFPILVESTSDTACVPSHLMEKVIYAGKSSHYSKREVHLLHVEREWEPDRPSPLLLHIKNQAQQVVERRINLCHNSVSEYEYPSTKVTYHRCWNMKGNGPNPSTGCQDHPEWLKHKIIKTGDTEIRYGDSIDDKGVPAKNYIVFDPPHLDFKEHPTGMPLMRKVVVQNSSPDNSVQLHSLSGNTLHFHCTFFQDKVVLPGGNTSFDVVFLGREEGLIENTIFIHTSIGTYKYGVRAVGTGNPYRLRPLVGVRMPLNSSYSPLIQLHNPHPHALQITEMYSTGGDLHLELLSGSQEGQKNVWNIPPYHTRPLMKANFVARRENNHTAYVRIVTSETDSDYLVVPVEVEVSSQPGLFCPQDGLHFGLRTPHDPPTSLPLYLLNSAHKHIHIQNVITTPVNDAISIDFKPMKIPPGTVRPTQVATVTFDPSKVMSGKKVSGKILIKSKVSAYKLSVPFTVDLLQGALLYNTSITKFYTGAEHVLSTSEDSGSTDTQTRVFGNVGSTASGVGGVLGSGGTSNPGSEPRNLTLTNTFPCPVVIYNITLPEEARKHFEIGWDGPVVVQENVSARVATLRLLSVGTDARLSTTVTVYTNVTSIKIPLRAYNGKLTKYIPPLGGDSWLDFGTLGMGEQRDIFFYVINENPVELRLRGWGSNLTRSAVELMGVEEGNLTTIRNRNNMTYTSKSLFLKPHHYAVFRIGVLTPDTEGIFIAEAFVQTQFEQIKIPFRLRTADGSLSVVPKTISFDQAFPGKISKQNLHILSTFGHPMSVKEVKPLPPDLRFSFEPSQSSPLTLQAGHKSHVGRLVFDPKVECGTECYAGFPLTSKAGQQWVNTLSLISHVADTDTSLYSTLRSRYLNLSTTVFNTSIVLHTSEVHGFHFTAKAVLTWPSLSSPTHVSFPLTQALNTSIQEVLLENPASVPVVAQILLLNHYPATQQLLSILPTGEMLLNESGGGTAGSSPSDVFTLIDGDNASAASGGTTKSSSIPPPAPEISSGLAQHRRTLEEQFKTRVAKDSIAVILEPGVKVKVRVSFTPPDEKLYSTVLLVRNNLTVIDAVLVQGRGGRGFLKFGNRKPGSAMPLVFNIGAKHLKDCDNGRSSKYYQPNFTVKRSFTARNTGELPVQVWGFNINDLPCEGYGFKVLNCEGFELAPNASHKVDIAFTPDFTLSKVQQRLVIHTSLGLVSGPEENISLRESTAEPGRVEYSLVATVPTHLLAHCGSAVPRPSWEPLLYYAIITLMVAMLSGAIILAALEADHILKSTKVAMTTTIPANGHAPAFDKSKVFDLRTIGNNDSKSLPMKNGFANGHAQVENIKPNTSVCSGTNNKKSTGLSSTGELIANVRKSSSGASSSKKVGNSQITSSSTKSKYTKQSDSKLGHVSGENVSIISDSSANQSKKPKGSNNKSNNNRRSESPISWRSFFSRAVSTKEESGRKSESANPKKSPNTRNKENSSVYKQSVGTGTDLQIVENSSQVRRRTKPSTEEETSSTTTESSNTDELSISERDTPSSKSSDIPSSGQSGKCTKKRNSKTKTSKSSTNEVTRTPSNPIDDDSGFEISTKVKGLKKLKESSGHTSFGGDIYQPNTLELPYTLKHVRQKDSDRPKDIQRNSKSGGNKNKESGESVGSSGSSPIPKWEETKQPVKEGITNTSSSSGLTSHSKPQTQPQPLARRESSYSAILLGTDKQKAKVTPFAKVPPEVKKVEKPLGVIGQKVGNGNSSNNNMGNIHGVSNPVTSAAVPPLSSNSLFTIPDNNYSHRMKEENYPRSLYNGGYGDNGSLSNAQNNNSSHSWDPKTLTVPAMRPPPGLVQAPDYARHHGPLTDEDWQYCNPQVGGSMWPDGNVYCSDNLGMNTNNGPPPSFWDSLPSIWSPSFWSNQGTACPPNTPSPWVSNLPKTTTPPAMNDVNGAVSKGLGFDPFHSVNNIWSAPSSGHASDLWAPPSTNKKEA